MIDPRIYCSVKVNEIQKIFQGVIGKKLSFSPTLPETRREFKFQSCFRLFVTMRLSTSLSMKAVRWKSKWINRVGEPTSWWIVKASNQTVFETSSTSDLWNWRLIHSLYEYDLTFPFLATQLILTDKFFISNKTSKWTLLLVTQAITILAERRALCPPCPPISHLLGHQLP